MTPEREKELEVLACKARLGILEGVFNAKCGHPGGSLSAAEILTYLYFEQMNVDPSNPKAENRDRFVLSKGHVAPGLYAVLALRGFFPVEDLKSLRKNGSYLQGHPSMKLCPGVDMSTGSLGQGISAAVGMALGAKVAGNGVRVYTLCGDGEIEEGQVWEAAMFAGNKKLDNLVAVIDYNGLQIDGSLEEVNSPAPIPEKFAAFGWNVLEIDAHSFPAIEAAFALTPSADGKPTCIVAKSVKGKGVSYMENQASWHGAAPNAEQYAQGKEELEAALAALTA
ncbi:MAG: transketolase [Oscillospiraceae bacterium]|nr:transketolase [Oscillospiraceae bacterium]